MNTYDTEERAKIKTIKTLAVVGFIAIIIVALWLVIQAVRYVPVAFSSLASLADSVYNNTPADTLTVVSEKSIVNAGESFQISWTDLKQTGTYTFHYTCIDGVAMDVRMAEGIATIPCDTSLTLKDTDQSIDLVILSERRRFVDVPFSISFTESETGKVLFTEEGKVTVVNASIPHSVDLALDQAGEGEAAETPQSEETPTTQTTTGGGSTGNGSTLAATTISYIPQSHEDGFTDLKVSYLGIGTFNGSTFVSTGSIDNDARGGIQFEVKNLGTKTSEEWSFEAELPTGYTFESGEQVGLKPNERAVYTIGFEIPEDETGSEQIEVTIDVDEDTDSGNDSFTWSVLITD